MKEESHNLQLLYGSVEDAIRGIRGMDEAECKLAKYRENQKWARRKTVLKAIDIRLRKLEREKKKGGKK